MLRLTTHTNAAAASHYFESGHDYMAEGQERVASWEGDAAKMLGLSGAVTKEHFRLLAEGKDPLTGESLLRAERDNRRVGTDFSFSAPKAVTLALEFTGDTRILDAFRAAVSDTMRDIEAEMEARVRVGGQNENRVVGNAVWATFIHRTARPVGGVADPSLHAHAFQFNLVRDEIEGKWKAAEIGTIRTDTNYWEAVMVSRLSKSMADLGYAVKRDGRYFALEGLGKPLLDKFSRRTKVIEAEAERRGVVNPEWKAELGGKTRERKATSVSNATMVAEWQSRLTNGDREQLGSLLHQTANLPTVAESVAYALDHCFERSSVNSERKVYETALRHGYGVATPQSVEAEAKAQGLIVKGGQSTTKEALARERRLISWARSGKASCRPILSGGFALPPELTPGQSTAVHHLLASPDRLTLIQGMAGVGKTTLLKAAFAGIRSAKLPVLGVAISTGATEELSFMPAATVAKFLSDTELQNSLRGGVLVVDEASLLATKDAERITQALDRIHARLILVGDVGQHSAVLAGAPFKAVQKFAGLPVARVWEIVRQTGAYHEIASQLADGKTDSALGLLNEIGWVNEGEDAAQAIATDYLWAIENKMTVRATAPTHAVCDAVNAAIRSQLKAAGRLGTEERVFQTLIPVSLTDAERSDSVGLAQREHQTAVFFRSKGRFKAGDRVPITPENAEAVAVAASAMAVYRRGTVTLAKGDVVRVTANGKAKGGSRVTNGTTYTVAGFKGGVQLEGGKTLGEDFAFLAPGYCGTSHSIQGKTYDVILASMPKDSLPAVGSDTAYVSLTRGKKFGYLYTDDLPALREAAKKDRSNSNASDLVPHDPPENRVLTRSHFVARVKQAASKIIERVRQLTNSKEKDYGYER